MNLTDAPMRNDGNAVRQIEETVFVMNPDTSELHSFNEVGASHLGTRRRFANGGRHRPVITEEFEIDALTAQKDALEFLGELQDKDLVRV